ncbi:MAG: hypothetical protein IH598_07295 [Bacteroidales bacterium]|nr:hypothetical protein [Bacteroidales bacterium]
MESIRNLLLVISNSEKVNVNSKASFYVLLAAFIILLIATESIIKQTFVPL